MAALTAWILTVTTAMIIAANPEIINTHILIVTLYAKFSS
jgi:hypothetical protein